MRYTPHQLNLMAQVVTDAKKNDDPRYGIFLAAMCARTGMSTEEVEREIETWI